MDFQYFDCVEGYMPETTFHPQTDRFFYVSKLFYDEQLSVGQETRWQVERQVAIDVPRSDVRIDGEVSTSLPAFLEWSMARYCTQSVMALPVEWLSSSGLVAERARPHRLQVEVWGNVVYVQKKLRVLRDDASFPVDVHVLADMYDPCIVVRIVTGILT